MGKPVEGGAMTPCGKEPRMNADQLKGKWMQLKGELKQRWGKFTDDDLQLI